MTHVGVVSLNAHCYVEVKPPECRDHVLVVCAPRHLGQQVAGGMPWQMGCTGKNPQVGAKPSSTPEASLAVRFSFNIFY